MPLMCQASTRPAPLTGHRRTEARAPCPRHIIRGRSPARNAGHRGVHGDRVFVRSRRTRRTITRSRPRHRAASFRFLPVINIRRLGPPGPMSTPLDGRTSTGSSRADRKGSAKRAARRPGWVDTEMTGWTAMSIPLRRQYRGDDCLRHLPTTATAQASPWRWKAGRAVCAAPRGTQLWRRNPDRRFRTSSWNRAAMGSGPRRDGRAARETGVSASWPSSAWMEKRRGAGAAPTVCRMEGTQGPASSGYWHCAVSPGGHVAARRRSAPSPIS